MADLDRCTLFAETQREAPLPPKGVETLPDLFEWQVQQRKDSTLFSFYDGQQIPKILSYQQTYDQVLSISHQLHKILCQSSKPNQTTTNVIGIWLEKSIELHLAILASTFSGSTWLPFDPDAPSARINACLRDSQAQLIICDRSHLQLAHEATNELSNTKVILIDDLLNDRRSISSSSQILQRPCKVLPNQTAYMIYTSGSTGTPKGIQIPHGAALTFALSERTILQTSSKDIVWQGFSPAFDMFIEEV